jgi:hypothetical protein
MPKARIIPCTYPAREDQSEVTVFEVELEQGRDTGLFKGSDDGALTFQTEAQALAYIEAHGFRPDE